MPPKEIDAERKNQMKTRAGVEKQLTEKLAEMGELKARDVDELYVSFQEEGPKKKKQIIGEMGRRGKTDTSTPVEARDALADIVKESDDPIMRHHALKQLEGIGLSETEASAGVPQKIGEIIGDSGDSGLQSKAMQVLGDLGKQGQSSVAGKARQEIIKAMTENREDKGIQVDAVSQLTRIAKSNSPESDKAREDITNFKEDTGNPKLKEMAERQLRKIQAR